MFVDARVVVLLTRCASRPELRGQPASSITFYGGSFIAGADGEVVSRVHGVSGHAGDGDTTTEAQQTAGFCVAEFDLDALYVISSSAGFSLNSTGAHSNPREDYCRDFEVFILLLQNTPRFQDST